MQGEMVRSNDPIGFGRLGRLRVSVVFDLVMTTVMFGPRAKCHKHLQLGLKPRGQEAP